MVKKRLVDYVRSMLSSNYPTSYIKQKLLETGYTQDQINNALDSAKHPDKHNSKLIFPILGALIIISTIVFFFYLNPSEESKFDLTTSISHTSISQGDTIRIIRNLNTNLDSNILMKYEILSTSTNKIIISDTENLEPGFLPTNTISLIIPQDSIEGMYIIRTIAETPGDRKIDKKNIEITKSTSTSVSTTSTTLTSSPTTTVSPTDTTSTTVPKPKDFDIDKKNTYEAFQEIRRQASSNEQGAINKCDEFDREVQKNSCYTYAAEGAKNKDICNKITNIDIKDECFKTVAKVTKNDLVCKDISTDARKDSCYTTFFLDFNDYSVCYKIKNKRTKSICENMRDNH